MKAVIYSRVSTKDQELENQLRQLRQYASSQKWEIVEEITDIGSGGKGEKERKGLERLLKLCHQKRCETVLFWSLDRLSREGSRKTIAYLTQFEHFGVNWHSYTEPFISSLGIFSDAIISLLGALARQERIRLSERTVAGLERAVANGKRLGRPQTPPTIIAEAKALRNQGLSYGEMSKQMGISRSRAHQLVHVA
jgi:putative DNA-invertase from lambdoid prophage Rac